MRTGSLDAVIVYQANTSQVRNLLDVVQLELPTAKAVQPYGVGRNSAHKLLMDRLLAATDSFIDLTLVPILPADGHNLSQDVSAEVIELWIPTSGTFSPLDIFRSF